MVDEVGGKTPDVLVEALSPAQLNCLPLHPAEDVHVDQVRGLRFAHCGWGYNAIDMLDDDAARLMKHADGRPAEALAHALRPGDPVAVQRMLGQVPMLLKHGFLRAPGVSPNGPTEKPERFFNVWMHITNACNLACPYCYVAKSSQHMQPDVMERVLSTIEQTARSQEVDRIHVRFSGGEPMLRFAELQRFFDEATRRCEKHGVRFTAAMLTNGTMVPEGAVRWLKSKDFWISLSMDGVGSMQNVMRPTMGGRGSFDSVRDGLKAYQDGGIDPYILITVGKTNLGGMLEFTDFLLEHRLAFRYSLVRDLQWGVADLDDRQGQANADARAHQYKEGLLAGEALERVLDVFSRCYNRIEEVVANHLDQGRPLGQQWRGKHKFCDLELWKPMRKTCGAGETYIAIGEDGSYSACHGSLHEAGTSVLDPSRTLFEHAQAQTQFPRIRRRTGNPVCNACRFQPSCAGGCPLLLYRRDGNVEGRSPYCLVFRDVIPRVLRIAALELALLRKTQGG